MELVQDRMRYTYESNGIRNGGVCRLRIYKSCTRFIIIATELQDNPGMSITNAIESVMSKAILEFDIDPASAVLIEHYNDKDSYGQKDGNDRFDRVIMSWNDKDYWFEKPRWLPIGEGTFDELLGMIEKVILEINKYKKGFIDETEINK